MATLTFRQDGSFEPIPIAASAVMIIGYAGRDQREVANRLGLLAAQGISVPDATPTVIPVTRDRLTQRAHIAVQGSHTSGEAEVVMIVNGSEVFLSVGSDHTDRNLMKVDVPAAKQVCPKVLGRTVWRLGDTESHWDDLELRAWIQRPCVPYQSGSLQELLKPQHILDAVRQARGSVPDQAIIFCGTLPLLTDRFIPSDVFTAQLHDPHLNRSLWIRYRVSQLV